jgi:hypothetical protein
MTFSNVNFQMELDDKVSGKSFRLSLKQEDIEKLS